MERGPHRRGPGVEQGGEGGKFSRDRLASKKSSSSTAWRNYTPNADVVVSADRETDHAGGRAHEL
jgi:hypothetical protein